MNTTVCSELSATHYMLEKIFKRIDLPYDTVGFNTVSKQWTVKFGSGNLPILFVNVEKLKCNVSGDCYTAAKNFMVEVAARNDGKLPCGNACEHIFMTLHEQSSSIALKKDRVEWASGSLSYRSWIKNDKFTLEDQNFLAHIYKKHFGVWPVSFPFDPNQDDNDVEVWLTIPKCSDFMLSRHTTHRYIWTILGELSRTNSLSVRITDDDLRVKIYKEFRKKGYNVIVPQSIENTVVISR